MATMDNKISLLKILCIHGYRQNDKIFRERTGAFRKIIKKHAELVFISAPNVVPPLEETDESNQESSQAVDQRGWWFSREDDFFKAQDDTSCCKGYKESLDVVIEAFKTKGPFDGVLGFSQGASMVSLMCGLLEQQKEACPFQFRFAVLVAAFKSHSSPHEGLYSQPITIPTLHVFGDTDKVIPKDMSEDLLQHFINAVIATHPGGHFIPTAAPQKKIYIDFLSSMMEV